jgi:hypothetical protein
MTSKNITVVIWSKRRVKLPLKQNGCERCGEWRWLELHHRNENSSDNSEGNMMVLCPNCHADVHGNRMIRLLCYVCRQHFLVSVASSADKIYCSAECAKEGKLRCRPLPPKRKRASPSMPRRKKAQPKKENRPSRTARRGPLYTKR